MIDWPCSEKNERIHQGGCLLRGQSCPEFGLKKYCGKIRDLLRFHDFNPHVYGLGPRCSWKESRGWG
jgi:hypothetical protein